MTSKRGVIPSKRISYPDTPLEIKAAKRRRKNTSKASSIIKQDCNDSVFVLHRVQCASATEEQHELKKMSLMLQQMGHLLKLSYWWISQLLPRVNMTVDNTSNASKDEEKVDPISLGERKNYPFEGFNISNEAPKQLTQLINDYSEWIVDVLLKHHTGRKQNDERYKVNESRLGFDMFDFIVAHSGMKNWFCLIS
ncbi:hypothetical protein CQW23_08563 [Capsicum baccatum]|uniref:Uncharacterized protein n=1 Tax=Capsicum baccatum TaxID=33114 RepID=A0A2G2X9S6_CAPBA|nr:hypothetical protein CQW23_08563 [Capsicum baccatum]